MQTIEFFQTVDWISSLFDELTRRVILEGGILGTSRGSEEGPKGPTSMRDIMRCAHAISRIQPRILENSNAVQILKSFKLDMLLDAEMPLDISSATTPEPASRGERKPVSDILSSLSINWRILIESQEALRPLLVPEVVSQETSFDELLTIELRYESEKPITAENFNAAIAHVRTLYASITRANADAEMPLVVIYADSGSSIRIDLRGNGKSIRAIKDVLVAVWARIRHRKMEDIRENHRTVMSSLEVVREIEASAARGDLGAEDAANLKRAIVDSALGLFEAGALPREVPLIEAVPNQRLLEGLQPRLLPPPPVESAQKSPRRKRKRRNHDHGPSSGP